jgi:hypothetical protein
MSKKPAAVVRAGLVVAAVAPWLFGGCGGSAPTSALNGGAQPVVAAARAADDASRCEFEGRADREVRESAGLGSIRPNIRRVYATIGEGDDRRRVLLCREVDTNLDGVKDVVRTFNDKGESLREVADTDYDGKVDTWVTFARGRIVRVEVDTNADGVADEFRYQVRGKLSRLQRDTNGDGRPDVWEIYEEGQLRRMGHDVDGDGRVDRWDRDEVAERAALARELAEEQRKRTEGTAEGAGSGTSASSSIPPEPGASPGSSASLPAEGAPPTTSKKP